MTFVGIDLAADVKRTGLAVLWEGAGNVVVDGVLVGATDEDLIDATQVAARAGVDVPFGWPKDFVETIYAHASGTLEAPASTGSEWRRNLALRATDQAVHQRTGLTPLSVSTDRIAYPALRWAGIEARLRDMGTEVARDGAGVVCEVYPAAALKVWGLPHRGYKGLKNSAQRAALVDALSAELPWIQWNGHRDVCAADDNALDAVIAALIAREIEGGPL
jgi:predicted nuclease with RNAse H fold